MANWIGTSGGWRGMNGVQRQLAVMLAAGFAMILVVIAIANASSMVSDFAAAHVVESSAHIWLWEISSILAWLTIIPAIWWLVTRLRHSRLAWWQVALIVMISSIPASLLHIGLMVLLRTAYYAGEGSRYRFMVGINHPILYEYRKDVGTFLQFASLSLVAQWLIARAASTQQPLRQTLSVSDGAVVHLVPLDEIEQVNSAGNYVEIGWSHRTLLHRATLAATAAQLGDDFIRIHRTTIVSRAAIRRIDTDRSGDFTLLLASGATARGSRRYKAAIGNA